MLFLFFFVLAFGLGTIPNAYLAGRLLKGVDIRQHGSGNVGATNAFRVLGKGPGIVVFILDFLKGAVPVAAFMFFFPTHAHRELLSLLVGLTGMLGHMFTPFLAFKGGKGIATGAGVIFASFPVLFAASLVVWGLCFFLTRIVSISSLLAVFALLLLGFFTHQSSEILWAFFGVFFLILWSHRGNIKKLFRGEEHRWS